MAGQIINSMIYMCFGLFPFLTWAQFTSNPPSAASGCEDSDYDINWVFDDSTNAAATVIWQKDGTSILTWIVSTNNYIYRTGYDANKINHANTNGKITLTSLNSSDSGTYACRVTYAVTGNTVLSSNFILTVGTCGDSSNGSNVKLIIGLGVGIPLLLIVLIILIVFMVWKSKRTEDNAPNAVELLNSHSQTEIIEKDAKIYMEQGRAILFKIKHDGKYDMPPEAKRQIITLLREYSKNAVDAPQQKIQSSLVVRIQLVAKRMKNENPSTIVEVGDRNVRAVVNSLVFILEMLNIEKLESEIRLAITLADKDQRVLRYMSEMSNQMGIDDVVSNVLKIINEIEPAEFMSFIIDLFPETRETHLITLSTVAVALNSDKIFRQNIRKVIIENI